MAQEDGRYIQRDRVALLARLQEQHEILTETGEAFDRGKVAMALPIATSVRVLVHDTGKSQSLLGQLDMKDVVGFTNTAPEIDPRNLLPSPGLVLMQIGGSAASTWEAPLGDLSPPRQQPPLPFDEWWSRPVATIPGARGSTWCRQDFVLHLANKEGGAHVDSRTDQALHELQEENLLGWNYTDPVTGEGPMSNGPIPASVRQIGWEVLRTVERLLDTE